MNRREFIALVAGSLASFMFPSFAFGIENDNTTTKNETDSVHINESIAFLMGENFFSGLEPGNTFNATSALPFLNPDGTFTGFIVHVNKDKTPYGYVIFDSRCPFGISEFSYGDNAAPSPWENITTQSLKSNQTSINTPLFQLDRLTYARFNRSTGKGLNNYGEEIIASICNIDTYNLNKSARISSPDSWNDSNVLLDFATVYRDYNVSTANAVSGYTTYSESYVEQATQRYACAVSAMITICSYYGATGGKSNLKNDYYSLWSLSDTDTTRVSGGITYGTTLTNNIGSAVKTFCAQKGKNISSSFVNSADWSRYKTCIDSGDMAIFSAELKANSSSGHSMAVSGYMTIVNKSDVLDFMNTLMVCDGWSTGNRILNHNSSHYSWHNGVFFSG